MAIPGLLGTYDRCSSSAFSSIPELKYFIVLQCTVKYLWNGMGKGYIGREWSFTHAKLLFVADKACSFEIAFTPLYRLEGLKFSSLLLKASLCLKVYLWGELGQYWVIRRITFQWRKALSSIRKKTCCYFQAWVLIAKPYFLYPSNLSRPDVVFWL